MAFFTTLLLKTTRQTITYQEPLMPDKSYIFVFWHGTQLLAANVMAKQPWQVVALASPSQDGQIAATWLKCLGFDVVRGSSSKKAAISLKVLFRVLKAGRSVGLTPDGPRGPARKIKPGILFLSEKARVPIVPVGVSCSASWQLNSWDNFMIPKPGAKIHLQVGKPIQVTQHVNGNEIDDMMAVMTNEASQKIMKNK